MDLDHAMLQAIEACQRGLRAGQAPFGAVIIRGDEPISEAHNTTKLDTDPTAHAEINAIRKAAQALSTTHLAGCILVSTCEPCPMCLAAAYWAGIDRVVFGASIGDAETAGFDQLRISAETLAQTGSRRMKVEGGRLHADCLTLFAEWKNKEA